MLRATHTLSVRLSIHLQSLKVSVKPSKSPHPNFQPANNNNLQIPETHSLHNTPPLLFLLLLRSEAHHLSIVAHGSARLVHVALERLVEPAADEAGRVAGHLGVAGAAVAVVFAAALVGGEVVEEALGGGGGLEGGC
jgi:hypothetical protein